MGETNASAGFAVVVREEESYDTLSLRGRRSADEGSATPGRPGRPTPRPFFGATCFDWVRKFPYGLFATSSIGRAALQHGS